MPAHLAALLLTAPSSQQGSLLESVITLLANSIAVLLRLFVADLLAPGQLGILQPAAIFLCELEACRVGREVHIGDGLQ
jgi:hypothetical protein